MTSKFSEVVRCYEEGKTIEQAASVLGFKPGTIRNYAVQLGIKGWQSESRSKKNDRNDFIRKAYEQNMPLEAMAKKVGMTINVLKVTAHRLGCTKRGPEWIDYRRGFSVPADLQSDYLILTRNGYRCAHAASLLGIGDLYNPQDTSSSAKVSA